MSRQWPVECYECEKPTEEADWNWRRNICKRCAGAYDRFFEKPPATNQKPETD